MPNRTHFFTYNPANNASSSLTRPPDHLSSSPIGAFLRYLNFTFYIFHLSPDFFLTFFAWLISLASQPLPKPTFHFEFNTWFELGTSPTSQSKLTTCPSAPRMWGSNCWKYPKTSNLLFSKKGGCFNLKNTNAHYENRTLVSRFPARSANHLPILTEDSGSNSAI